MTTFARIALSLVVAFAIAALALYATRFHVFFFPFVFVVGAPLWWIWKPSKSNGMR